MPHGTGRTLNTGVEPVAGDEHDITIPSSEDRHSLPAASSGLTEAEVAERRRRGLVNTAPDRSGRTVSAILRANVFTLFNAVVGGSFALLLVLGAWRDALFGFFVIANTLIGVVQEFKAKNTLAHLSVLSTPRVLVRRAEADTECEVAQVVLDDLLVLRAGEQLAADAEAVVSRELEVDESLLTGEADPISVEVGQELLSGSIVLSGSGLARVIRVGADSYAARITSEARQFSLVKSELRASISRIIRWTSIALLPTAAILVNGQIQAAGGWPAALSSGAWRESVVKAVGGLVAMVPQGLVFMTSVALAVGAVKLARGNVLVHELTAVEGLARVDMLCVDKTGTLTEGSLGLDRIEVVGPPVAGWEQALAWFATDPSANATARAIHVEPERTERVTPDATVAFSSSHKWSAAHFTEGGCAGSWVLGGADVVLSSSHGTDRAVLARAADLAASGYRTLVFAHSPLGIESASEKAMPLLPQRLDPVALVVLRERVRDDAADTVAYFREQGVEVCVISGDDPRTVAAVARAVDIAPDTAGIDARSLPQSPEGLAEVVAGKRVFGRVTPDVKKNLVTALQAQGHTVAMIGDGVNDTLALKHADLGIAMGSGSPAARAVADLVLLDGTFATLPAVVAEGRRVVTNVERLSKLFLSKTVYSVLLAMIFGMLLLPYPFLPRQLSIIDGLTIGLPALVLALLPNPRIYRPGFIRRALWFCIPNGSILAGTVIVVALYARFDVQASPAQTQTAAVIALTLSALWVLSVLARPFTWATAGVLASAYAGLLVVLSFPFFTSFLRFETPQRQLVTVALGAAVVTSALLEVANRTIRPRSPER